MHCLFKTPSYAVWRFEVEDHENIIVVGDISRVDPTGDYKLYGQYIEHPKYGIEFNVRHLERLLPTSYSGIIAYLASDVFKGVGVKTATKVVQELGEEALLRIREDRSVLDSVDISKRAKDTIIVGLSQNVAYEDTFYCLLSAGLSTKDINKIIAQYKENTDTILKEDPYQLYYDIYGIGFKKCEDIAIKLGFTRDFPYRLIALIHHLISELNFKSGDTYCDISALTRAYDKKEDEVSFDKALDLAIKSGKIIVEEDRYYTKESYTQEYDIAKILLTQENRYQYVIDEKLSQVSKKEGISYDDEQIMAINKFFDNAVSLIVGGPGTGKTTIIKAIIETIKKVDPTSHTVVVAPTGRAAKRIRELCQVESETIHALLKWDKETNTFVYGIFNPLMIDYLIIDEFSMVDSWLFASLLKALGPIKKIAIIGDDNQLPSVGPGDLLHDLISSDLFATTHLKNIHRQEDGSSIISLCHQILDNEINLDDLGEDITFIDENEDYLQPLIDKIDSYLASGYDINDIQLLSPMYKGQMGIDILNSIMQKRYNPAQDSPVYKDRYRHLYPNDKIIQLKNQRDDDVYNGDIGTIIEISNDEILARFDDIYVAYSGELLNNIALAYCISVHKSQGSEYPVVLFCFSRAHLHMLNKNLIYTAISRASKHLVIVGDKDVLMTGITHKMKRRKTTLLKRLYEISENAL